MRFVQGNSKKNMANAMTGQTFIRPGIIKVPWHLAVVVVVVVVICISILEWYQLTVIFVSLTFEGKNCSTKSKKVSELCSLI